MYLMATFNENSFIVSPDNLLVFCGDNLACSVVTVVPDSEVATEAVDATLALNSNEIDSIWFVAVQA